MPIDEYFRAQQVNREKLVHLSEYQQLVPLVDSLYRQSAQLVPEIALELYGRVLLICHSSFLSATSLLLQAQPHDAAPVTRRAIEAIRLAAAVKEDKAALEQWIAFEQRQQRWQDRQAGERPKHLNIALPVRYELVQQLLNTWGMLSDAAVHFTPEFLSDLSWDTQDGPAGRRLYLNYFHEDIESIRRDLVIVTGSHAKILRILDWCWDSALVKNSDWGRTLEELYNIGNALTRGRFE